jgi:hypothetical protein
MPRTPINFFGHPNSMSALVEKLGEHDAALDATEDG